MQLSLESFKLNQIKYFKATKRFFFKLRIVALEKSVFQATYLIYYANFFRVPLSSSHDKKK